MCAHNKHCLLSFSSLGYRLKERFELRREHYHRHLKEKEEELLRAEKELVEQRQQLEEAEEKRKQEVEKKASTLHTGFDYSSTFHSMGFFSVSHMINIIKSCDQCSDHVMFGLFSLGCQDWSHTPIARETQTHQPVPCLLFRAQDFGRMGSLKLAL